MDLEAEYRRRCTTRSDINVFLPRLVELVEETDAMHVIELGVRSGNSTVAWLHGLERTGGSLTSIDVSPAPDLGAHKHWRFVQGDDLDSAVLSSLDQADIVFIDTTHEYAQTLAELIAYRPLVRPGGYMILHDTELVIGGIQPVKLAVEALCAREGFEASFDPRFPGLGEIKVA